MIGFIVKNIVENSALVLTACTATTIGICGNLVYKPTNTGIKVNGEYITKERALLAYIGTILLIGALIVPIQSFWEAFIPQKPFLFVIGLIIIMGTLAVDTLVPKWRHIDKKSLSHYGVGVVLIVVSWLGII